MKIKLHFCALLAFLTITSAFAQDALFKSIPYLKGIQIKSMSQDPLGYVWFATDNGLYRYDGYETKRYLIDDNRSSDNSIQTVYADNSGLIWFSSIFSGLHCLDTKTGTFKHFSNKPNDLNSLSSAAINSILKDKKGILWVGTSSGLNRLEDINTGKFTRFQHNNNIQYSLSNDDINILYEDKKGILWIGTKGGLNRFDSANEQFKKYSNEPNNPNSLINDKVKAIFEDSKGSFWVSTEGDGLHTMNRANGVFQRHTYDPLQPNKLSGPPLKAGRDYTDVKAFIKEDGARRIWIGNDLGICFFNYKTGKTIHFDIEKNYNNIEISTAFISKDSLLWISTKDSLYQFDPYFKKLVFKATNLPFSVMQRESSDVTWFLSGTELIRRDSKTGAIKAYSHNPNNPKSLSPFSKGGYLNKQFSVGKKNKIWIGTNAEGLDCFDKQTELVIHLKHDANNPNSIMSNYVDFVHEDGDNLWIGTEKGLDLLLLNTGKIVHFQSIGDSLNSNNVSISAVFTENKDKVWIGANGGLTQLNPFTGKIKNYLKGIPINSILNDAFGIIWLGTDFGLYKYDADADKFSLFKVPYKQTISDRVDDVQEDERKNLWIGSNNTIFKINPTRDFIKILDTDNGTITSNTYVTNSKILFVKGKGYYAINEGDVRGNPFAPQISISDLQIVGKLSNNGGGSRSPFSVERELILKYNENVFSFNINAIHYSNPADNRVLFKLENYDPDWRPTDGEKRASYINVPPGEYLFQVKAFNSSGVWLEEKYLIIITPPWWKSVWAYLFYAVALLLSIRVYSHYRSQKLKEENILLEEKVVQRTNELAQKSTELEKSLTDLQSTQAQLIQSEKLASLGELTAGIAHEIQNPLNFVNNFSELSVDLIKEIQEERQKTKENRDEELENELLADLSSNQEKINHHGKRASNIVKGMLEHSRASTGAKEPTDINAIIKETLPLSYNAMRAKDKGFEAEYNINTDEKVDKIEAFPQDIARVLINLFSNAFYAVNQKKQVADSLPLSEKYTPSVSVTTQRLRNSIEIRIKDNGTGMPEGVRAKVFQPFFTTKPTGQGTGLGLSLAYDIVTKGHGGSLEVESTEGIGSEFIITLPFKTN
jgi:signal transduction histidine kinase/ligand-binding sensor domain-containing protein